VDRDIGWHWCRDDDGRIELDQFLGEARKTVEETIGEAVLVANIASLDIAALAQVIAKGFVTFRRGCLRGGVDNANERNRWLLRARDQRPRRCTA